jgi:hypothetical protein
MVAGGRGHGAEASSSRAGRPAPGEGRVDGPPAFADAHEEQGLWEELRDHGTALNLVLNEALRIHGGPAFARLSGEAPLFISFDLVVFTFVPSGATLTGFGLLAAGARASHPQQVWCP